MARKPGFSTQTLSVLAALEADPAAWLHGYLIAKQTGLASGTSYPILIRLADRRLIGARWEDEQPAGRPRRHLYRSPEGSVGHAGGSTLLALLIVPLVGAAIATGRNPVPPGRSAGIQQSPRT